MNTIYLCDTNRNDYEQYLKQAILFRKEVDVVYPHIKYSRPVDIEWSEKQYKSIERYCGFEGVTIKPIFGEYNRLFDQRMNPVFFIFLCDELGLNEQTKHCFIAYAQQELAYEGFMDWPPFRSSCGYMHSVYNIFHEYLDELRLFYDVFEQYKGNITTNSSLLHRLLSLDLDNESAGAPIPSFDLWAEYEDFHGYTEKHCEECKKHKSTLQPDVSSAEVNSRVIEFLIPDYTFLEPDDLFELRNKAADEILALSDYIDQLSIVAADESEVEKQIRQKVKPAITDLTSKVKNLRLTVLKSALTAAEVSTVPVIVKLLPDIPAYIPLIGSAAILAGKAAVDIQKEKEKLKTDPLYFKIKLNRHARRIIKRNRRKKEGYYL